MSMRQRSVTGITFFEVSPGGSIREIRSCTSNGTSGAVSMRRCSDRTLWSSRRCGSICLSRRCDWTSDGRALPRAVASPSRLNEIPVSDHATLDGLTQFLTQFFCARSQTAEDKSIGGLQDLKERLALHCFGPLATR